MCFPLSTHLSKNPSAEVVPRVGRVRLDLAGVLGRIHSIRVLCNGQSDQYWRNYMRNLLELEAPSPGYLRSRMVDNFNSSYTEEQAAQGSCSVSATRAETTLSERGRQITDSLASMASGVTP